MDKIVSLDQNGRQVPNDSGSHEGGGSGDGDKQTQYWVYFRGQILQKLLVREMWNMRERGRLR